MDDKNIVPSKETIRRFHERATALYEQVQGNRNIPRSYKRNTHGRDISEYQVDEPAPTELYFQNIIARLLSLAVGNPDTLVTMRRYVGQWALWLKLGLSTLKEFEDNVQTLLPNIASCWMPGAKVLSLGSCQ